MIKRVEAELAAGDQLKMIPGTMILRPTADHNFPWPTLDHNFLFIIFKSVLSFIRLAVY